MVAVAFVKSLFIFVCNGGSNQIRSEVQTHDHDFQYTQLCGTYTRPPPPEPPIKKKASLH